MSELPNPSLSIVIPTFNRAEFLDYSLEVHVPLAKKYNIQIFISDNASSDNTAEVVEKWLKEYSLIRCHRNETNLGPDGNFEIALKLPDTEYIWLLGDTYRLPDDGVKYILDILDSHKHYDALVINLDNKLKFPTNDYADGSKLLGEIGALMSCLSCLVYNKAMIANSNFSRYRGTFFIQTGVIFEYVAQKRFIIHWAETISITALSNKGDKGLRKSNWSHTSRALEIGVEKWANFIFSLPAAYSLSSKLKAVRDFGVVSGLLSWRGLFLMRANGVLTYKSLMSYKRYFLISLGSALKYYSLFVVCILPVFLLKKILCHSRNKRGCCAY